MDNLNQNVKMAPPVFAHGSRSEQVFNALRVDAWIPKKVVADLIGLNVDALSATLTNVRRTGWIEYRHMGNRVYEWRKRTQWAEPQDDIVNRSTKAQRLAQAPREPDVGEHLEHARYHLNKAMEMMEKFQAIEDALKKAGYLT